MPITIQRETGLKVLTPPLADEEVLALHAGDEVLVTGYIYTARDAAHKRMYEALERGESLPFDIRGQIIYYVGPTPAKPGKVIGSAGPTTSGRVDKYTPRLYEAGLKASIGKGDRNQAVREALQNHKGIYLAAYAGTGVLISRNIKEVQPVAYEDLGTEAIVRLRVESFPCTVMNDAYGKDLFQMAKEQWQRVRVG
ncbi:MAG: Fe-S-containing hydro-lyase [Chloroflexi bacterium]|nr:Fe-S-containing hydro-lyase [Chloroflexota bacterium]